KLNKKTSHDDISSHDPKEDVPLRILRERRKSKKTSANTIRTSASADSAATVNKYKIQTLTEYQQMTNHFEQQIKTYNKIKRSLNLYIMKSNEIRTEMNYSDSSNFLENNLEKVKKLFGDDSKCQEEIKTFYELQIDLKAVVEGCNKAVKDGIYE
ncbi:22241_t:CDS:1, partial [Dentiscutata erythropus]